MADATRLDPPAELNGNGDVLRCLAHEARRNGHRLLRVPLDERAWINSLRSPALEAHVRSLNAVDRAVASYRANHPVDDGPDRPEHVDDLDDQEQAAA